eukprot:2129123-Pleurochrysis_carterae.AAC.1
MSRNLKLLNELNQLSRIRESVFPFTNGCRSLGAPESRIGSVPLQPPSPTERGQEAILRLCK